jgi:hypothetical protein
MKKSIMLLLLTMGSSILFAQKPAIITNEKSGWHKIGETRVDFKTETDEIIVLGKDKFEFVKLFINDSPVNLISFIIYFEDNTMQNVSVGQEIKAAGETRVVDLKGAKRIKKVSFVYKTVSNRKDEKANVELWGLRTKSDEKK